MEKNMKTIGIIGGLGPETSAKFQLEILSLCLQNNKKQRPPFLLWNVPVDLKVEEAVITKNGNEKAFLPLLKDAAKILEKAGADFLVMPCNTLHIFIEDIRKSVNIPSLSIIDEAAKVLRAKNIKKVGILATSKSVSKNIFGKKLQENGIEQVFLKTADQVILDKIIHRIITGEKLPSDIIKVNKMIDQMVKEGARHILLACTDLQLIVKKHPKAEILDTMQILAEASANKILKGGV
jgi:aspartate racemase